MEDKHTPYYYIDTQLGDRYCIMDGNDMSKNGAYRMLEEIKQVAALTKENEKYKDAVYVFNEELTIEVNKVKALTEQVEDLKAHNSELNKSTHLLHESMVSAEKRGHDKATEALSAELSRLREERKELVGTLKQTIAGYKSWDQLPVVIIELLQSLLDKFNDSKT